jgi:kinesin family protein 4/21/27
MVQVTSNTNLAIDSPQGKKLFVFDRVFGPDINQEGVWDYLNDCVSAFLQGYNVSLLAYGQSGAGKSYTMGTSGPAEQGDPDIMGKTLLYNPADGNAFLAVFSNVFLLVAM